METTDWKVYRILAVVITVICLFISIPAAIGFVIGSLDAILLYKRNESYWSEILDIGTPVGSRYGFHYMINIALMALPMLVAVLYPQYINVFTVALGLMMIKITVTLQLLLKRGREK